MAKGFKFTLNKSGVNQLLKSDEMKGVIEGYADGIAHRAGNGYEVRMHETNERVIANVYADTDEAIQDNLENNTLLKSMRG